MKNWIDSDNILKWVEEDNDEFRNWLGMYLGR